MRKQFERPVAFIRLKNGQGAPQMEYSDFLMHYGIKGQKWGVRRFQNEDGTLTIAGKERYRAVSDKDQHKTTIAERIKEKREAPAREADRTIDLQTKQDLRKMVDRDKTKKGSTKEAQAKVAVDVLATLVNPLNVANLITDGAMAASAKVKTDHYLKKRERESIKDPKTGLYLKKDGQYSEKADLAAVNPGFANFNSNTKNNCMLCTTTYDMRKRGYDVTAQHDSEGYNFRDLKRWYPKAKFEKSSRVNADGNVIKRKEYVNNTVSKMLSQGNGARGNLMVWFVGGGGHSMFYEIQNGSLIIKDGQANKVYKNPTQILGITDACSFARLDNVQPNLKAIIKECVM